MNTIKLKITRGTLVSFVELPENKVEAYCKKLRNSFKQYVRTIHYIHPIEEKNIIINKEEVMESIKDFRLSIEFENLGDTSAKKQTIQKQVEKMEKNIKAVSKAKIEKKVLKIELKAYSDKSFAVIGETKDIKDKLKELGGRYNPNLSCGKGWIFSNKRKEEVETALLKNKYSNQI